MHMKFKMIIAVVLLCVLSTIMTDREPQKYDENMRETNAHKQWVKKQQLNNI